MKFTPILPPAKPSPPTIPNRTGGTQHTTHCVPEEVFKLRLLAQNVNDDADDFRAQVLHRFISLQFHGASGVTNEASDANSHIAWIAV